MDYDFEINGIVGMDFLFSNGHWRHVGYAGGTVYGSLSEPVDLGSGGGAGGESGCNDYTSYGDNGGGVIHLVVSDTLRVDGVVRANGGNGYSDVSYVGKGGGGAGGSIWLEANILSGGGRRTSASMRACSTAPYLIAGPPPCLGPNAANPSWLNRDRVYFKSIYTNDPDGHVMELAMAGPGFTVDEDVAGLGQHLKLPPWLEQRRNEIERSDELEVIRRMMASLVTR